MPIAYKCVRVIGHPANQSASPLGTARTEAPHQTFGRILNRTTSVLLRQSLSKKCGVDTVEKFKSSFSGKARNMRQSYRVEV